MGPTAGEDDVNYQRVSKGFVDPTIEVRDRFSELGTPLISRCLAFQGPDIDPYLRYAIEVDVANMVQGLEKLLDLDSSGAGTSSQAAVGAQPALPEYVENFDAEGEFLVLGFPVHFGSLHIFLIKLRVCFMFCKKLGGVWDEISWSDYNIALHEGMWVISLASLRYFLGGALTFLKYVLGFTGKPCDY